MLHSRHAFVADSHGNANLTLRATAGKVRVMCTRQRTNGKGAMNDPGMSTTKIVPRASASEVLLTELFGPVATRVRAGAPMAAYTCLLFCVVFLRHHEQGSWPDLRERLRKAVDEQSAPSALLRVIGRRVDEALRKSRLPSGVSASLGELRGDGIDDLAHVIHRCEELGPEDFPALLDRSSIAVGSPDGLSFTPRSVADLITEIVAAELSDGARVHDPHVRRGELLAAALRTERPIMLSGNSPSADTLRVAGMNLLLHGGHVRLSRETAAPWNEPVKRPFDLILTNPPFNNKGSVAKNREGWLFGPPGATDNYAWLQYIIASLSAAGKAIVLMPNRAAVSPEENEHHIRTQMLQQGTVEFIIALPRQIFAGTDVPTMIWGLRAAPEGSNSVLFIDVRRARRKRGQRRVFNQAEIQATAECLRLWRAGEKEFARAMGSVGQATAASVERLEQQDYSLDPSDYLDDELTGSVQMPVAEISEVSEALKDLAEQARTADRNMAHVIGEWREPNRDRSLDPWRKITLGEICELTMGPAYSRVKNAARAEGGIPIVVPSNLRDRRVVVTEAERITAAAADDLKRFRLTENDILFVRTGSVGPVSFVTSEETGYLFGTNLIRIRCHEDVDPGYVLAYLSSGWAQRWIHRRTESATAIPSISVGSLKRLPVNLPPPAEQARVSGLLAQVDRQITAHRKIAETASELRTLLADGLTSGATERKPTGEPS
jgi:type I restriction enzyme M protein